MPHARALRVLQPHAVRGRAGYGSRAGDRAERAGVWRVAGMRAEGGRRKAEGGRRKAEGGRRKAEGGRRKAEGGRRKAREHCLTFLTLSPFDFLLTAHSSRSARNTP